MNTLQCARQIKFKLLSRLWPDSPNGPVFGNVFVTQGPAEDIPSSSITFPCAIVKVLDSQPDEDEQRYQVQRFEVDVLVAHSGDQIGEAAMIGALRPSVGSSKGRGVLEIEEQVLAALQFLDPVSGVRMQLVSAGTADTALIEDFGYVVCRPLIFQARLTTDRDYPAPNAGRTLRSSVAGSDVSLSWTWHERWDLRAAVSGVNQLSSARGQLLLVRKSGGTAPANVNDGTVVTLASNAATGVVNAPGSGTWSYSLFALYDEFGDGTGTPLTGTAVRTSTAASVTGIVV